MATNHLPSERLNLGELREQLAKLIHHRLAAAQNLPYEDGDTCVNCYDSIDSEFLPIIEQREQEMTTSLQRMTDLVRYARSYLHNSGLISDNEYAELLQTHGSVARLEGYDQAVAKLKESPREVQLSKIAERLARSLGHTSKCKEIQRSSVCDCGEASKQAQTLHDYQQWKDQSSISNEVMLDNKFIR